MKTMDSHSHTPWFTIFFGFIGSLLANINNYGVFDNFYIKAFIGGILGVVGGFVVKFLVKFFFPKFYKYVNDRTDKICNE